MGDVADREVEVDSARSRDLDAAIGALDLRKERRRLPDERSRRDDLPKLRRDAASERGAPVEATLRFRYAVSIARFEDFARRKRVEATIGRDGVWTTYTMKFRNKTARTTFLGQWGEESCDRK